jgi:NhaP-type Na+/H+ or K+/H+ antiporter
MQVVLGPVVGALLGGSLGSLLRRAQEARWSESDLSAIAGLCVAALCYLGAEAVGGNGFMAAFVGGMAFGATAGAACEGVHQFLEREGELMMIVVFMLLGCALAGPALALATHAVIAYALLSLTIVRLLPVGLSLLGTETSTATKLFLGWFGPRGLASILFGMLLLEEHELPHGEQVFAVVVITVLGSVFLHGGSAAWGSERYGTLMNTDDDATPP